MPDGGIDPLALLCAPLLPGEFFERHWGRASFTAEGEATRFESVYALKRWEAREFSGPVDAARVVDGVHQQRRIETSRVAEAWDAGMTICGDVTTTPELATFLDALSERLNVGRGGFAKLYASPPSAGFAMHFDPDHVFVLQLRGRKRWWFGDAPALPFALCGGTVDGDMVVHNYPRNGEPVVADDGRPIPVPTKERLSHVDLTAGDLLYLPPGTWHVTEALEESVAVSLSPPRVTVAQVLVSSIQAALGRAEGFRRDVLPHPDESVAGPVAQSVVRQLSQATAALAAWVPKLSSAGAVQTWCARVYRSGAASEPSEPIQIRRSHVLQHVDPRGLTYVVAPESPGADDVVFIYHRGEEWVFPVEAEPFVQQLAVTPSFRADDALAWDASLSWDDARDVLEQLVQCGILRKQA